MTDASGTVVWAADYKPFGEATITVSTITNNLRFPGQYFDVETGLHYNYYRDYNPVIGRYIESDPIGLLGGINPFLYALDNPGIFVDPFGLQASQNGGNSCGCQSNSSFSSRSWNNAVQSNSFFFSGCTRASRSLIGLITSGTVAQRTGGVTLGMWWSVFPRGYATLGGLGGTTLAFLSNAAMNSALIIATIEPAIAVGSVVNALPVYGTNQSVGSWWGNYLWNLNNPQQQQTCQ